MRTRSIPTLLLVLLCGACQKPAPPANGDEALAAGVEVTDIVTGDGEQVQNGDRVIVHYTGWLYDEKAADHRGRQFDSSRQKRPFSFVVGDGQVIDGWDQGVPGMRVGGTRRLLIPSTLAYGAAGAPPTIPPHASLWFDIEVLHRSD